MLLQCWNSASELTNPNRSTLFSDTLPYNLTRFRKPRKPTKLTCLLKLGVEDIAEIAHNKVLIAAGVSAAIGQLSKPFTSELLYGKGFDFKAAFQAGGFPSTHSSSVVAAATSLALERRLTNPLHCHTMGFSDSIFGLTVVYAGLVMYDAQGVRREVGNHAKALNKVIPKTEVNSVVSSGDDLIDSQQATKEKLGPVLSKEERTFSPNSTNSSLLLETENKTRQMNERLTSSAAEKATEKPPYSSAPLKESIGHTEVEVITGALLGFFVSIAVYAIL